MAQSLGEFAVKLALVVAAVAILISVTVPQLREQPAQAGHYSECFAANTWYTEGKSLPHGIPKTVKLPEDWSVRAQPSSSAAESAESRSPNLGSHVRKRGEE
jgi:hypothetical protein